MTIYDIKDVYYSRRHIKSELKKYNKYQWDKKREYLAKFNLSKKLSDEIIMTDFCDGLAIELRTIIILHGA